MRLLPPWDSGDTLLWGDHAGPCDPPSQPAHSSSIPCQARSRHWLVLAVPQHTAREALAGADEAVGTRPQELLPRLPVGSLWVSNPMELPWAAQCSPRSRTPKLQGSVCSMGCGKPSTQPRAGPLCPSPHPSGLPWVGGMLPQSQTWARDHARHSGPEQEMAPPPRAQPPREPTLEAPGHKAWMDLHICLVPQDTGLVGGALERGERSQGHVGPLSPAPGSLPGSTHRCARFSAYTCSSERRCLRRQLRPRAGKGLAQHPPHCCVASGSPGPAEHGWA